MKTFIKKLFLLLALIAGSALMLADRVTAQTFTTLYSFTATSGPYPIVTNSDGSGPGAGLILSGKTLYGTAYAGGSSGNGTLFAVNADGTGFTNLHSFTATSGANSTNSDGAGPPARLILSGNTLYGTAYRGGGSGNGTLFALNTNGTGFTNLHSFTAFNNSTNSDGASPNSGLIVFGATLYGTATKGGGSGNGMVFAININGTGFTNLHSFTGSLSTNSDGASPAAGLILSGNTLYGTTQNGGSWGNGTVFAINTAGTGFTNLHSFAAGNYNSSFNYTNSDGSGPAAALILSGATLYGTAFQGGSSGYGTVFEVNTNGSGFTNLHSFTITSGPYPSTNNDGAFPFAELILSATTLYGTAYGGGNSGNGTVFAVNTNGTGFTNLYSFTGLDSVVGTNIDGANPFAGSKLSNNTLYGTASGGGNSGKGAVFSLSLPPPPLTIIRSAPNVILTWPTNAAGFTLQSTTNLVSPAVWSTVSPGPVAVNGQNAVTNPISGTQQFYRLSQ